MLAVRLSRQKRDRALRNVLYRRELLDIQRRSTSRAKGHCTKCLSEIDDDPPVP